MPKTPWYLKLLGFWLIFCIIVMVMSWTNLLEELLILIYGVGDEAAQSVVRMSSTLMTILTVAIIPIFSKDNSNWFRWGPIVLLLLATAYILFRYEIVQPNQAMQFRLKDRWVAPVVFEKVIGEPAKIATPRDPRYDFPQFLGPQRRQVVDTFRISEDWAKTPPLLKWRIEMGDAWSGFAVSKWLAVTMEQFPKDEAVTCYDLRTGEQVWKHLHPGVYFHTPPGGIGPRATPTIDGDRVYTMGATGILDCLKLETGEVIWSQDITNGDQALVLEWGKACSPLIVDNKLILSVGAPEGKSLQALDKMTGNVLWSAGDHVSSYASPELHTLDGVPQIIIVNQDFVDGHDAQSGELLWSFPWPGLSSSNANTGQAFAINNQQVFVSKHYFTGSAVFNVTRDDNGKWNATKETVNGQTGWAKTVLRNKINNISVRDGVAYGIDDVILQAVDIKTGNKLWKGGRYGGGQLLMVRDHILVQADYGDLILVAVDPNKFREIFVLPTELKESPCWNPMTFAPPYLIMRNAKEAVCLELPGEVIAK